MKTLFANLTLEYLTRMLNHSEHLLASKRQNIFSDVLLENVQS